MTQVPGIHPFHECDLADQLRFDPTALVHFLCSQRFAPPPDPLLSRMRRPASCSSGIKKRHTRLCIAFALSYAGGKRESTHPGSTRRQEHRDCLRDNGGAWCRGSGRCPRPEPAPRPAQAVQASNPSSAQGFSHGLQAEDYDQSVTLEARNRAPKIVCSSLSREQLREFLTEVILTPAGKVNEQSRLCQSYKVTPEIREFRNARQTPGP